MSLAFIQSLAVEPSAGSLYMPHETILLQYYTNIYN